MWERVRTQGEAEGWIKQADISEDDGTPVKNIVYDRWDRFFTLIDLCKYGNYRCEKKDDFLKEFGLRLGESGKVSEAMKGHKELLLPVYYKKESKWLDSDEHTNALISKYTMVRDAIMQERTDCEFWDGLNEKLPRECYYFNPKGFLNHLDKVAGVPEFNPYEGKTYDDIYNTGNGVCEGIDMGTRIVDNPGFAPVYDGVNGRKDVEGFAGINGFFNEDYSKVHSDYQQYWHEGVDFAGIEGTVIKSLVFGEVVDFGTHNKVLNGTGMGDYMIVRDAYDKNKYYLLLHLAYESWKKYNVGIGTKVYPGMKVAGVGKPDYFKTAYHLHVSVIVLNNGECPIYEIDDELHKKEGSIRNKEFKFPIWGYKDKMRDPFNHKTTWKGRKK